MWTDFDLSGLADDAGQPVELIHKRFELIHRQFGSVTTALRAQTAAAVNIKTRHVSPYSHPGRYSVQLLIRITVV